MLTGSLNVLDPDEGIPVKMSKSLGNYVTIKDALNTYRPQELRYFILSSHYSNPVVYSEDALASAKSGWERLMNALRLLRQRMNSAEENEAGSAFCARIDRAKAEFAKVMDDDFNSPRGIAVLQDLTREVNTLLNSDTELGLYTLAAIDEAVRLGAEEGDLDRLGRIGRTGESGEADAHHHCEHGARQGLRELVETHGPVHPSLVVEEAACRLQGRG